MECFPSPRNALPEWRAEVAKELRPWDGIGDLETYLALNGLPEDIADWYYISDPDVNMVLQSWLFFGLLSHLYGRPVVVDDYLVPHGSDGRLVLSLRPLATPSVIRGISWTSRAKRSTYIAAQVLAKLEAGRRFQHSPVAETSLAIYMLLDLICIGWSQRSDDPASPAWHLTWTHSFLRTKMIAAGWCPQQVSHLFRRNSPAMVMYVARLPRNNPSKIIHASCTELKCIGNNVELGGRYKCRHVADDCYCDTVFADADKVKAIISRGGVPLVSIHTSKNGSLSLKVSSASYFSRYTAMSHVWADGLGNPNGNGLPACQLRRLATQLAHVAAGGDKSTIPIDLSSISKTSPLFWMDTLCIPVGLPDDDEVNRLKATAINSMARIYAGARQVLVVDAELQSHTVLSDRTGPAASQDEVMAWTVTATWMRRCWTLHEGALGRRVWFQFADAAVNCRPHERSEALCKGDLGVVDLSRTVFPQYVARLSRTWPLAHTALAAEVGLRENPLQANLRDAWRVTLYQTLELLGYGFTKRDVFGRATPEGLFALFCLVWDELIPRSTTKAEDLPTIFASLLDFKAHQMLRLPTEHRMLAMLANMPLIPQELLFNRETRLRPAVKHSNRWVPVTTGTQTIVPDKTPIVPHAAPGQGLIDALLFRKSAGSSEYFAQSQKHLEWDGQGKSLRITNDTVFVLLTLPDKPLRGEVLLSVPSITKSDTEAETRHHYRVQVHRAAEDAMDLEGVSEVGFLFCPDRKRGCILFISGREQEDGKDRPKLKAFYDCSVSLESVDDQDPMIGTSLSTDSVKFSLLEMETDAVEFFGKFNRRPHYRSAAHNLGSLLFFVPLGFALLFAAAGTGIRIYLEVKHKYSIHSTIGIVSLVLFGLDSLGLVMSRLPYIWPPISPILFAIDRQRDPGYFGTLEVASIVTHILGCYGVAVLFFSTTIQVVGWVFKGLYYMYWVRSFAV